jgi:serine/threonine protein phosphatase PrpC
MFSEKPHGVMNAFGANTHQGISRNYNEDKVAIIANIQKPKHKQISPWPVCSFFAIYDGHGGHKCANFMKENLHWIIINQACFP